ncbi:MAG: class F sortase [Candidatus Dormibacteraeota bacterium]|nr:class F sortase [Candidatus Dormibacteraeota bacterium]
MLAVLAAALVAYASFPGAGVVIRPHAAGAAPAPATSARLPAPAAATGGMQLATPTVRSPLEGGGAVPAQASSERPAAGQPQRIEIAGIGVSSTLSRVGLEPDGTIQVPSDHDQAAWYAGGPAPGEQGPAVILGHLDSFTGPGVFWNLAKLHPGDPLTVVRQDGVAVGFHVTRVESFPRDRFPVADVYGALPGPELRLITCGGTWDWGARRYGSNLVVFAAANAEPTPPETPAARQTGSHGTAAD